MPVEFLMDEQAAKYAAYDGAPSHTELERFFFLDDVDRALIEPKRRAHNRLGFAVQIQRFADPRYPWNDFRQVRHPAARQLPPGPTDPQRRFSFRCSSAPDAAPASRAR